MTTAKQKARQEIKELLQKDLEVAKYNVRQNLWEFKRLAAKQEVLKRKVAESQRIISMLEKL